MNDDAAQGRRPVGRRGLSAGIHDPLRLSGVLHRTGLRSRQSGIRARAVPARAGKRHRFAAFIDANVAASWPALVHEIAAYAQAHARHDGPGRAAGSGGGGRAREERSGARDAAPAAPRRTRHRSPLLRGRRGRRRAARHGRVSSRPPRTAACVTFAFRPPCWRRTIPASA